EEELGPGGAMTRAMEELGETKMPSYEEDFTLIDTPGQLEVFAFHKCGPQVVSQFENPVGIFLLDASIGIEDLPAVYLYALATRYRLRIDTISIVNKVDLLDDLEVRRIGDYLLNPGTSKKEIEKTGVMSDIYSPISELLQKIVPAQRIPRISAKNGTGFDELFDIIHEVKCACGDLT
ncbi:MAG: ATP/GTP-binding protein, partial [archaeon]